MGNAGELIQQGVDRARAAIDLDLAHRVATEEATEATRRMHDKVCQGYYAARARFFDEHGDTAVALLQAGKTLADLASERELNLRKVGLGETKTEVVEHAGGIFKHRPEVTLTISSLAISLDRTAATTLLPQEKRGSRILEFSSDSNTVTASFDEGGPNVFRDRRSAVCDLADPSAETEEALSEVLVALFGYGSLPNVSSDSLSHAQQQTFERLYSGSKLDTAMYFDPEDKPRSPVVQWHEDGAYDEFDDSELTDFADVATSVLNESQGEPKVLGLIGQALGAACASLEINSEDISPSDA